MTPFRRILFPVDFSERCSEFGAYVSAIARRFEAEVTLLHVIDSVPLMYSGMDPTMSMASAYAEAMTERRMQELEIFLKGEFAALPVKRVTETGEAGAVVAAYAAAKATDLIMMPTHGYGPFRRLLLGSVTAKVLHDVDCPVWTSAHWEAAVYPSVLQEILCAVDFTPESLPLVRFAAAMAKQLDGELRLVHAIPTLGLPESVHDAARKDMERLQREAGTNAESCIEDGEVAQVVQNAALHLGAGLIVIGRGRMPRTLGHLRTSSYNIIRESPCPVLSVYLGLGREAQLAEDSIPEGIPLAMA